MFHVNPAIVEGTAALRIVGRTNAAGEAIERRIKVVQEGFPISESVSGVIANGSAEHTITLPATWLNGSLQVKAHFFPSSAAELQGGLEAMRREPAGCFEQAASSNGSNVLILDAMKQASQINLPGVAFQPNAVYQPNPAMEKRARSFLQSGYAQLADFECIDPADKSRRGFDWFAGAATANEALTAYGLMQYRDMAAVFPVEDGLLKRTEKYLLDGRDQKGSFQYQHPGRDRFGRAPDHLTNAYILWALTESGAQDNLDSELAAVRASCKQHNDPYLLALAGMSHLKAKKTIDGIDLLQRLRDWQQPDGKVEGAKTSITGSQGHDLLVETTALAAVAWLKAERADDFGREVNLAVKWLGQQRRGPGGFGSTQATLLALKALVTHRQKNVREPQGGEVRLFVRDANGIEAPGINFAAGRPVPVQQRGPVEPAHAFFSPRSQEPFAITLNDPTVLRPGKNVIALGSIVAGNGNVLNGLPYTITWSPYRSQKLRQRPQGAPVQPGQGTQTRPRTGQGRRDRQA